METAFLFWCFINLSLTDLDIYPLTYSPGTHMGHRKQGLDRMPPAQTPPHGTKCNRPEYQWTYFFWHTRIQHKHTLDVHITNRHIGYVSVLILCGNVQHDHSPCTVKLPVISLTFWLLHTHVMQMLLSVLPMHYKCQCKNANDAFFISSNNPRLPVSWYSLQ